MRKYGIKKDKQDRRDIVYALRHTIDANTLPQQVDLRSGCSPVVDQGDLASCTSNAIVSGLREFILINNEGNPFVRLSRLYHYWLERYLEDSVNEDSGATLRDGMKVLAKYGVCRESSHPYDESKFTEAPTSEEIQEGALYRVLGYQRLLSIDDIKHALSNNHVVVFSMTVYQSFEEGVGKNGIVSLPQLDDRETGGHAMCIVGYDDTLLSGCFIVRNSWGTGWGDRGYCYMPYEMFKYFMDAWTVKFGS